MAINFAAANMAGYNNPQIEVFEAVLVEEGPSLAQYPAKSVILNCLSRGSLPVIMLRFGTSGFILPLSEWDSNETGDSMSFTTFGAASGDAIKIRINYPSSGSTPSVVIA